MKSNLDSLYKTDAKKENEGEWDMIDDETGFLLRRSSPLNPKFKAAMVKYFKPHARKLSDNSMKAEQEFELGVKAFVDICLVDWKGVVIEGVDTPYSKEAAINLLTSLPELFKRLEAFANDVANYKEELGNS